MSKVTEMLDARHALSEMRPKPFLIGKMWAAGVDDTGSIAIREPIPFSQVPAFIAWLRENYEG